MKKTFDRFGVMIDMSRNSVMKKESLFEFMKVLKKMRYNSIMLYTEDTYEVEGYPYFGYLRGRYSIEELKEIDDYAYSLGIEVIPCIQTLAHLNGYIRWKKTPVDCQDILLTDDGATYKLIDAMFSSLSKCFRSKRVHIGMDEAHMLGRGKHLDIHGYETVDTIMKRHLAAVVDIAKKYGYSPLMWSDMFFRGWNGGAYRTARCEMPKEYVDALPKEVTPIYWDYYATDKESYDDMFYNHRQLSDDVWFFGGAWCWSGIVPHNAYSLKTMLPAMQSCRENGIKNVFLTLWGDDGGECSHFSQLAALFHIIEAAHGNTDLDAIKAKFKRIVGYEYDDFMALDIPNKVGSADGIDNPSKYMLFSDPFLGFLDYTVKEGDAEIYTDHAKRLYEISKNSRKYSYLFKTEAKLSEVLAIKYDLGVRVRRAYTEKNIEELKLIENDFGKLIKLYGELHNLFSEQWHKDYKPHGFDIQDLRLGGMIQRLKSCRKRLNDLILGRIEKIDELDEIILSLGKRGQGNPTRFNTFLSYYSPNVIGHI
ncbi:MAG: beta-N-acetylhexosaminidase [Clostridia bacterium]|nr:beta-N-acetylhexosaminidase [Clostridia bacterium]